MRVIFVHIHTCYKDKKDVKILMKMYATIFKQILVLSSN